MGLLGRLFGKHKDDTGSRVSMPGPQMISTVSDAPFEIVLRGQPNLHLILDREYEVIKIEPNGISYMFIPADQQSSALLSIGGRMQNQTEKSIAKMYEGSEVTKSAGKVNGKTVEWWRWKDSHHLYSRYTVTLIDREAIDRVIIVDVVANTPARLEALERAFSTIGFL